MADHPLADESPHWESSPSVSSAEGGVNSPPLNDSHHHGQNYSEHGQTNPPHSAVVRRESQPTYAAAAPSSAEGGINSPPPNDSHHNGQKSREHGQTNLSCSIMQPFIFPRNTHKNNARQVDFFLHVENFQVDEAYIRLSVLDQPIPLYRVGNSSSDQQLWTTSYQFNVDPTQQSIWYKYSLKGSNLPSMSMIAAFVGKLLDQERDHYSEVDKRFIHEWSVQFDVFRFPNDSDYCRETVPRSVLFYADLLLLSVTNNSIGEILVAIKNMKFKSLNPKGVKQCLQWILESAVSPRVTDEQRLYLCAILGHLPGINQSHMLPLQNDRKTRHAFDCLLQCLEAYSRLDNFSRSSLELDRIAPILVEYSSCPGWLTIAAYFYPYLGIDYVLGEGLATRMNDKKEFQRLVKLLLSHVNIKKHEESTHQKLLQRILQIAPDQDAVLELYGDKNVRLFFDSEADKDNFFASFYQESSASGKFKSFGKKLVELMRIPEKLRCKIHSLVYPSLSEFAKSVEEPTQEDVEVFFQLIASNRDVSTDEVQSILTQLSESKSTSHHRRLLDLLGNKMFEQRWHDVTLNQKVNICASWIVARTVREASTIESRTLTVFRAIDDITSCSLNVNNKSLTEDLSKNVCERLLKNEDAHTILKAFKNIEELSPAVQECYKNHVKIVLKRDPRLIRNSSNIVKQYQNSRLGQALLTCVLDVIEIPSDKEKLDREAVFKKMLEWCDIWITLLSTKGNIEKKKKFKRGKEIWQDFQKCITGKNLSPDFVSDLLQQKEEVSQLIAVLSAKSSTDNHEFWRHEFLGRISELARIEEDCHEKFSLLEAVIKYGKKLSEDPYPVDDISAVIEALNERKKGWRTKKLQEVEDDSFWGPLFPLLDPGYSLRPLIKSVSFTNVAEKCLQEYHKRNSPVADDEEQMQTSLHSLIELLTTEGIEKFQAQWNPVFNDPGSLNLLMITALLGSLKRKEKLEKEFSILEEYFNRRFPGDVKLYINDCVEYPEILKQVRHVVRVLDTFGLMDSSNKTVSTLKAFENIVEDVDKITLKTLHESMITARKIVSHYSGGETDGVVEELGRSSELLAFVKEIVGEDIRFLIDAVEEHSDQFVSESSVSDLIDVHGFLAPLIKKCQPGCDPQQFLVQLDQSCAALKDMAVKIHQCSTNVNSLKGLYTSVANRGEITKEIIANCLKKGVYTVSLENGGDCKATMSYIYEKNDKSKSASSANYSLSELHDLRSRAHLIINSDKNQQELACGSGKEDLQNINFSDFIEQVNLLTEITELLLKLHSSGYVKYRRKHWKKLKGTGDLQEMKNNLSRDLKAWEESLSDARQKFYFLNYYRSDQLCILHDFLAKRSQFAYDQVLSLIHFVDPKIGKEHLDEIREMHPMNKQNYALDNPQEMLSMIGEALEEIFSNTSPVIRPILHDQDHETLSTQATKLDATVKSGELFVASLEAESLLTANVMLTLYENTSNAFPEPYQVVFCGPQTTWEEIQLLLARCFAQTNYLKCDSLFCIANVEQLANEVQFELVKVIKEKQKSDDASSEENTDYRLALICRGGDHHHIVEEFAQYSHHISGMSDLALSQRLKSRWPDVKMITSTLPGLGKTEGIRREVLAKNMNVTTFSISGPLYQNRLIQRLKQLNLKKYHCLHLDIGEVNDPLWLDTFLFQLIVTGMVSSGTQLYHLQTAHVYIEIANTLKDWLLESLVISKNFTRVHMQWRNYEDLIVSSEITSDIQVVCQYFNVFDRARLESCDVYFSGPKEVRPLPDDRCRKLLAKYYSSHTDITFTALNTFLGVLADQLLKFSGSAFFKITNLKSMLGDEAKDVRTNLFRALLQVSKEFASRAITTCRSSNLEALSQKESAQALDKAVASVGMSAEHMVERVEGMIQWEDSNHLLVVFHGAQSQAIAAVYRNKSLVPGNVENLLNSQVVRGKKKELEDFKVMTQEQLQEKLEKIACTKASKESSSNLFSSYALTPDNILKMILIILRVRVNAPVIIMGETGCGKTSLVRYLANTCQIQFYTFNFHAGITEDEIKEFIEEKEDQASECGEQIWVFLDEINTCDHLGLINDVMCHHALLGRPLSQNLVFLAACNPYKLRPKEHIETAGLEGKNITDEYSGLVYRVHPLPEAMIDYVWDYGSLGSDDEKVYIQRMVRQLPQKYQGTLVDLLAESQKFIRESEKNHFCVSLRDVHRCILLVQWFMDMLEKRKKVKSDTEHPNPKHLQKYRSISERYDRKPEIKSIVLALAHCYLSRLPTAQLRQSYRQRMMLLFSGTGTMMGSKGEVDSFSAIVRIEEEDYLDRMELPPGTARNAALRENVFVMLVSILNRIPVFVVGKPGCSKSLSMQLIRTNLRGRDSRDRLFRELPQLYVVSYQGSESSKSEGIIKVFDKARKYKEHNEDGNVLPVVLLDEVGLAENSRYNPLKVLHSLLEPGDGKLPDVAVVGISNWALDAAKMNRAIHLSRPEPTVDDLYETGHSLHYADTKDQGDYDQTIGNDELRCLAEAYYDYQTNQRHANFHGLRDYYSLIKSLSLSGGSDLQQINVALQRNFGGIPGELTNIQKIFLDKLKHCMLSTEKDTVIPITKLIQENLTDPRARHLMLITSGHSAIGILKQNLTELKKEIITIFGSRFEEDLSEDYNYRILSRIILCMERDCILILRDLESIYGSLYDMLNQNYAVVGKRKNCRVALGAFSNPMCHVNDGFRCIVLTDHHKVDFSDPPFLNRFEKQLLRFSDVLNERQLGIIKELDRWVRQISTVAGLESQFNESDIFVGYHEDTLPSLVLLHSHDTEQSNEEIFQKCKDDLMWVATPDGVLRTQKCVYLQEDSQEVKKLGDEYFEKPIHDGLVSFMKTVINDEETSPYHDKVGSKTIVMTYSNIHMDISKCLGDTVTCQTVRLGAYKSEKQLAEAVNYFWSVSEKGLLVLQCKPELDGPHMLLARSIIEDKRSSYEKACEKAGNLKQTKHVCIVVHVQRGTTGNTVPWQFTFLCGWRQVFLDVLEAPPVPLNEIRTRSVQTLLTSAIWPLRRIIQNDLLWCFTCIKYTQHQRTPDSILHIARNLLRSEKVYRAIEQLVLNWVIANGAEKFEESGFDEPWQVKVACDRQALINSSTVYSAMEQHVSRLVCQPLAKIIYFLEKENAWPPHVVLSLEDEASRLQYDDMWCEFMAKETFFNMSEIPEPLGAESYILGTVALNLHLPFSQVVIEKVNAVKDLVLEDHVQVKQSKSNLDGNGRLTPEVQLRQLERYSEIIAKGVPEIHDYPALCCDSYMVDLFDIVSADFSAKISRDQRVSVVKSEFLSCVTESLQMKDVLHFYAQLHLFVWISKEKIFDELRLVDCCQQFVRPNILKHLTDDFLSECQHVLPFRGGSFHSKKTQEIEEADSNDDDDASPEFQMEGEESIIILEEIAYEIKQDSEEPDVQDDADVTSDLETITDEPKVGDTFTTEPSENEAEEGNENDEEEEENDKQQECFEDVLVKTFCEEMLPSKEIVEKQNGGFESWIRNASLVLSLTFKISDQAPAFHYLRLCVDFAKTVLASSTPAEESFHFLYVLKKIASVLQPEYLDADESFQKITECVIKPLKDQVKDEEVKHKALQKFSALFYGRCLDTNVDTSAAGPIVEHVLSLHTADMVPIMSPVILRLLLVEEMESPRIFFDIITNQSVIENFPCLKNIDDVLFTENMFAKAFDSYAAVMVCDLIQPLLNFDERYSIDDLDSSDCELLKHARGAINVLSVNKEKSCELALLSSVAFLRAFFTMLANFIAKQGNVLKGDTPYSHALNEINSLLTVGDARRRSSLQMFFLKQLHQSDMTLFELRKLCRESEMLPVIKNIFQESSRGAKAEFVSVCKLVEYEQVKAAYWKLTTYHDQDKDKDKDMLIFLDQCHNSPTHRLALMGILGNMIYLKRAVEKLTAKDELLADWFSQEFEQFPLPLKEVLLCVIGRKNFIHSQMQLSPESSSDEVETALLILHIACVLASSVQGENSPLYQYFRDPSECRQSYILAHGKDRIHRSFEKRKFSHSSSPVTCDCGLRIMFQNNEEENKCPYCSNKCENANYKTTEGKTGGTPSSSSKGYSPGPAVAPSNPTKPQTGPQDQLKWDDCTDDMEPSVFRALHLIVHACLYAGVAMQVSSKDDLSSLLNLKDTQSSEMKKSCQDPMEFCLNQVKTDLKCLTTILCCRKEIAIKIMHLVVEECTELIRGESLKMNACSTPEQRLEWEIKFSNLAKDVLPKALGSARALKEAMRLRLEEESEANTMPNVEDQIQELDEYPTDADSQNQLLRRVFRVTKQPSIGDFRSALLNARKDFQEKHSFLYLFFAKFDDLPKIGHLYHLLAWARLVSSALTHRISREDAQSKSINDFITGHLLGQDRSHDEKESCREIFKKFKEAWNYMRPFVSKELRREMPRLVETDRVAYCLTESDSGVYLLTAIRILVSLQNSILDEMIFLSMQQRHPALSFLEKDNNCSGVWSVSLQEVKEKEIVNFRWSDDIFIYAQNNPEYGHGEEIIYDFERMEIELANEVAFGKCHLTGSLNKFIFSKELFHSSGPMLTEIRKLFPESSNLPDNVRQGLSSLKERRIKDAQTLLQHIEVLFFLLKFKLKNIDGEMTLETFVEIWQTMLPSPFPVSLLPEPSSIKLRHLAAFYEALEDLLADGAIEGLQDQFREDLTDETKKQLNDLVDNKDGDIKLQTFLNALRRFVFRYLSSEKFLPEPNTPFSSCLKETSLWSPADSPDTGVIPKDLTLEYIHSAIIHLQELDKERKGNTRKLGGMYRQNPDQFLLKNQFVQKKGQKKRRVTKFSRF